MTQVSVVTHVFNEEFLLPFWLRHHRRLFDHGVVIDYASTDRTREIVRELAPDWELRPSRNECFDAHANDREVMEVERELSGWKLVLNVTEFLFHEDLRGYLGAFERSGASELALGIPSVVMADRAESRGEPVDPQEDLFFQRHHGYFDHDLSQRRLRFLHRGADGAYELGRHGTGLPWRRDEELLLLWWGYSPYDQVRSRKLQIQTRMPQSDKDAGWGWQHVVTEAELDRRFLEQSTRAGDLLSDRRYRGRLEALLERFGRASRLRAGLTAAIEQAEALDQSPRPAAVARVPAVLPAPPAGAPRRRDPDQLTLREWYEYHQRTIHLGVVHGTPELQQTWLGRAIVKNPLDCWVYQEILAETRPDLVLELGVGLGGGTLFLASLLDLIGHGSVLGVDRDLSQAGELRHPRISLIEGDCLSPAVVAEVRERCQGQRVMVIADCDHSHDHVLAELRTYASLVAEGCYYVVEDGVCDVMGWAPTPGPRAAAAAFLAAEGEFVDHGQVREKYLITYNPGGYLRRVARSSA